MKRQTTTPTTYTLSKELQVLILSYSQYVSLLVNQMNDAIEEEDYLKAAKTRDQIDKYQDQIFGQLASLMPKEQAFDISEEIVDCIKKEILNIQ